MDETPEELEQIRRDAEKIDVHQYRKRFRFLAAIGLGAAMAGLVWLIMCHARQPARPVRARARRTSAPRIRQGVPCKSYTGILDESLHDDNADARQPQGAVPVEDRPPQGRRRGHGQVAGHSAKILPGFSRFFGSHRRLSRFCQSMTSADCSHAM